MSDGDAVNRGIQNVPQRVIESWLQEFGYPPLPAGLKQAMNERPLRIARELDTHGRRLADRAQMSARPMQGRAGVIR